MVAVNDTLMVNTEGNGKIFAGGDIIDIPRTVVNAVASGKKAAIAIDCDYRGTDFGDVVKKISIGNGPALSFSTYMNWKPAVPRNIHLVVDSEKIVYDYLKNRRGSCRKPEMPRPGRVLLTLTAKPSQRMTLSRRPPAACTVADALSAITA